MIRLRPQNILVVGGGGGLGKAIAQKFLQLGAKNVVIASRNISKLEEAARSFDINSVDQHVYTLQFDITETKKHLQKIAEANALLENNATLDGLVIAAGVDFDGSNWKGFNISEEKWDFVMNTNLKGVFFLMRNFANYLFDNKIKGNICILSSISAHRDMLSVYQISKHCVSRIVNTYGKYLCERGCVLNAVEPGPVYTDMMKWLEKYTDGVRPGEPWNDSSLRRLVRPEEIADIVAILMSDLGEVMSGACLLAGGGAKSIFPC